MSLFSLNNGKFSKIQESKFDLEKHIQKLTENNLNAVFGLDFVKSEFSVSNLRIDTLAFDKQSKSFVIIEYKRDKSISVIDQGFAYLNIMLNNKSDFVLEYNENTANNIKRDDVDWTQSKVIFISPNFTEHQKIAIGFKDLPIELWEVKRYQNDIVLYNQLKSPDTNESINKIAKKSEIVERVSREVKVYTEDSHLERLPDNIKEIYDLLKNRILEFGNNIEIQPKKYYIAFVTNTNFVDIELQKSKIKLWINLKKGKLNDYKKIFRDVSKIGHLGNGDYEYIMSSDKDLDYLLLMIKESYKEHSK